MISVDANYKGNRLNKDIKKDNFKKDLMNLIETNHQINMSSDHSVSSNNHQINITSPLIILFQAIITRLT